MDLSELVTYARNRYKIEPSAKGAGFSVLQEPESGKWIAVLISSRDPYSDEIREAADIKCGRSAVPADASDTVRGPFYMESGSWVGVPMGDETDSRLVARLLDRAFELAKPGYKIVMASELLSSRKNGYSDTPLPRRGTSPAAGTDDRDAVAVPPSFISSRRPAGTIPSREEEKVPEKIAEMRKLYRQGSWQRSFRDENFYRQGKFMEDYEDDAPWDGNVTVYYPTYNELTTRQLRGYFTWRTALRRGEWGPICASLAFIYVYELINGIGTSSPQDGLDKLIAFEKNFTDSGFGDELLRYYLRLWIFDFCVVNGLDPAVAREYQDGERRGFDDALCVLRSPQEHSDAQVTEALLHFTGDRQRSSAALKKYPERCERLFAAAWREACANAKINGRGAFSACFGSRRSYHWYPFLAAIYRRQGPSGRAEYELNGNRKFSFANGEWKETGCRAEYFKKKLFNGFLRETDRLVRAYLGAGRPLAEKEEDEWATPFIEKAIEEDRLAQIEASRPRVELDFTKLGGIRSDAAVTRDSLLTEEDVSEDGAAGDAPPVTENAVPAPDAERLPAPEGNGPAPEVAPAVPYAELLTILLRGGSVKDLLAQRRLMPELVADGINEALFDELGDTAVECVGDDVRLVPDYREDIERIMGKDTQ
ncbi:MAG: TerB N-terminal domain-containing protein [Clostridia bacterium]|nr:TerB N-terminal domain-containing protein [Clostridia bacterium]